MYNWLSTVKLSSTYALNIHKSLCVQCTQPHHNTHAVPKFVALLMLSIPRKFDWDTINLERPENFYLNHTYSYCAPFL